MDTLCKSYFVNPLPTFFKMTVETNYATLLELFVDCETGNDILAVLDELVQRVG